MTSKLDENESYWGRSEALSTLIGLVVGRSVSLMYKIPLTVHADEIFFCLISPLANRNRLAVAVVKCSFMKIFGDWPFKFLLAAYTRSRFFLVVNRTTTEEVSDSRRDKEDGWFLDTSLWATLMSAGEMSTFKSELQRLMTASSADRFEERVRESSLVVPEADDTELTAPAKDTGARPTKTRLSLLL